MSEAAKDETPPFKTKGKLIKHKGHWFPVVSFPNDQQFETIRNFPLHESDVMVASYQKSGCVSTFATNKLGTERVQACTR